MIKPYKHTNIMLTLLTQVAIAVLNDIYTKEDTSRQVLACLPLKDKESLFDKLCSAGLLTLVNPEKPDVPGSYELIREPKNISLLDILEATGEHLVCTHPTTEAFYSRYRKAAQKLGIINHMTRVYLQEIKLYDL